MEAATEIIKRESTTSTPIGTESAFFGISIRAWIVAGLSVTICGMAVMGKTVEEPLYSGFMISLGYYFGNKTSQTPTK